MEQTVFDDETAKTAQTSSVNRTRKRSIKCKSGTCVNEK